MQKSKKFMYTVLGASALWGVAAVITTTVVAVNLVSASKPSNAWKVKVTTNDFSDSSEVKLNISDLSSQFINNPLKLFYKAAGTTDEKVKEWTPTNPNEEVTLGGLESGTVYEYRLQSGDDILAQGTVETKLKPEISLRGTTANSISFVVSKLDASYVGSTFTVRYALASEPSKLIGHKEFSVSDLNKKLNTKYYEVLDVITAGLEENKQYIVEVFKKNEAGVLTLVIPAETKDIPMAELVATSSYSADLKINGLKSYIEVNSKDVQFLVKYTKSGQTTPSTMALPLGTTDPLNFTLKNLDPATQYSVEVFMVKPGNIQTKISSAISFTTSGDVTITPAETSYNSLEKVTFENLTNLGDITTLSFSWVAQPQSGEPQFFVTNSIEIEPDLDTATTGVVNKIAGKLDNLKAGTTYLGQIFANNDFDKPLLKTPYQFKTLSNLTLQYEGSNLKVRGLDQLSTKALKLEFKEVVPEGGTAAAAPSDADFTPTTSTDEQSVSVGTSNLVIGKEYTLKVYLASDSSKKTLMFAPITFKAVLKPLTVVPGGNSLKINGLEQMANIALNFVFTEEVASGGTTSTVPSDVENTPTASTDAQSVAINSANLTVGKKYTLKVYLKTDSSKSNPLFESFSFTHKLLPLKSPSYEGTSLKVTGLDQMSGKELNLVFSETVPADGAAVADKSLKNTPTTTATEQTIDLSSASLTAGKEYTVKIYLGTDTEKANPLFDEFKITLPAATTPPPAGGGSGS